MTLIFWTGNFHCLKTLRNEGNQVTARNEHLIYLYFSIVLPRICSVKSALGKSLASPRGLQTLLKLSRRSQYLKGHCHSFFHPNLRLAFISSELLLPS